MSIHIDSCELEMIIVTTRSSVYELIVLPAHEGVLVRGGSHFPEFRRALFCGSIADDGSFAPGRFDVGGRLQFVCGDRGFITSAVDSVSLVTCGSRLKAFVAKLSEPANSARSHGSLGLLSAA